jgi:transcriptional regulator with XRE-family HTH domain
MRARRKEAHFSQAELSQLSGVSLGSLKRFEQTGEISLSSLVALAQTLNCEDDLQVLFSRPGTADVHAALKTLEDYVAQRTV